MTIGIHSDAICAKINVPPIICTMVYYGPVNKQVSLIHTIINFDAFDTYMVPCITLHIESVYIARPKIFPQKILDLIVIVINRKRCAIHLTSTKTQKIRGDLAIV